MIRTRANRVFNALFPANGTNSTRSAADVKPHCLYLTPSAMLVFTKFANVTDHVAFKGNVSKFSFGDIITLKEQVHYFFFIIITTRIWVT